MKIACTCLDGQTPIKQQGFLTLRGDRVEFWPEDASGPSLVLERSQLNHRGPGKWGVEFDGPPLDEDSAPVRFFVSAHDLGNSDLLPQFTNKVKHAHSGDSSKVSRVGIYLGAFFCIIFILWSSLSQAWRIVPVKHEVSLGETVMESIVEEERVLEIPVLQQFLDEAARKLSDPESPYEIKVSVIESSDINAFALPGGHVSFYSELIRAAESPEEILGVLAHEIAHVELQHGLQHLSRSISTVFVMRLVLGGAFEEAAILETFGSVGSALLLLKYSRTFEDEADALALQKLTQAGIDPNGFLQFFERLTEAQDIEIPAILSTHPSNSDRIENIKSFIKENTGSYESYMSRYQWDVIKAHLEPRDGEI